MMKKNFESRKKLYLDEYDEMGSIDTTTSLDLYSSTQSAGHTGKKTDYVQEFLK